jgi:hypothetical protein
VFGSGPKMCLAIKFSDGQQRIINPTLVALRKVE